MKKPLSERMAAAGITDTELVAWIWPILEKRIRETKAQTAETRTMRHELFSSVISGLVASWSYEDRIDPKSAAQIVSLAWRIVNEAMKND